MDGNMEPLVKVLSDFLMKCDGGLPGYVFIVANVRTGSPGAVDCVENVLRVSRCCVVAV
jgi:hypothetical protein